MSDTPQWDKDAWVLELGMPGHTQVFRLNSLQFARHFIALLPRASFDRAVESAGRRPLTPRQERAACEKAARFMKWGASQTCGSYHRPTQVSFWTRPTFTAVIVGDDDDRRLLARLTGKRGLSIAVPVTETPEGSYREMDALLDKAVHLAVESVFSCVKLDAERRKADHRRLRTHALLFRSMLDKKITEMEASF